MAVGSESVLLGRASVHRQTVIPTVLNENRNHIVAGRDRAAYDLSSQTAAHKGHYETVPGERHPYQV